MLRAHLCSSMHTCARKIADADEELESKETAPFRDPSELNSNEQQLAFTVLILAITINSFDLSELLGGVGLGGMKVPWCS